jgi:uncharacterized protein YegL
MTTQYIYAIIDRSGSMYGKEDDTINGLNAIIDQLKQQKEEDETIYISLKLFDHEQLKLWYSLNIKDVSPITSSQYQPRGQTSLYDAIGDTINEIIEDTKSGNFSFNDCIIYVTTDGYENSSRKYTSSQLSDLIKKANDEYCIKLIYLGANQDAILEASKFGIPAQQAMTYSETRTTTEDAYRCLANVAKRSRSIGATAFLEAERQRSVI